MCPKMGVVNEADMAALLATMASNPTIKFHYGTALPHKMGTKEDIHNNTIKEETLTIHRTVTPNKIVLIQIQTRNATVGIILGYMGLIA